MATFSGAPDIGMYARPDGGATPMGAHNAQQHVPMTHAYPQPQQQPQQQQSQQAASQQAHGQQQQAAQIGFTNWAAYPDPMATTDTG